MRWLSTFLVAGLLASTAWALALDEPVLVKAPPGSEENDRTPASLWSTEQRLALRFDPAHAEKRRAEYKVSEHSAVGVQSKEAAPGITDTHPASQVITIDGSRHPELFLPIEVFDGLVSGFNPDLQLRALQRDGFRDGIESFGFDDDSFWNTLWPVAKQYVELKYAVGRSDLAADRDAACRERFAALTAARKLFGAKRFDQLLYEVVAPLGWMSSVSTEPDPAAELKRQAAGCQ